MSEWKNFNINKNMIVSETSNGITISMPKKSKYNGYSFWHPKKCVRSGRNSSSVSIGFTDDFHFVLIKYGNGKYNRNEVIDEITIDASEMEDILYSVDQNIW